MDNNKIQICNGTVDFLVFISKVAKLIREQKATMIVGKTLAIATIYRYNKNIIDTSQFQTEVVRSNKLAIHT